jgi:serine/threonine protein kinase
MSNLVGQLLANRYRVEALIGHGGMAEVYKVWDIDRSVPLALKLLHEDLAQDVVFLRRFRREAQTLAQLQHPNIVRFYGLDQDDLSAFILMDYVEGTTLRAEIARCHGQPMNGEAILGYLRPICAALNYAHRQGKVHCDVKPANILIDKTGHVFVSDFGIARMTESATTTTMVGAGTPAYMSPEQARGENPTPQADIYALGVMLFEMLTGGERPFTGDLAQTTGSTSEKVRWEQMNLRPPSPRKWDPQITPEVEAIVLRCLEKDPIQRFASTLDLLKALEKALPQYVGAVSAPAPSDSSAKEGNKTVDPHSSTAKPLPVKRAVLIMVILSIGILLGVLAIKPNGLPLPSGVNAQPDVPSVALSFTNTPEISSSAVAPTTTSAPSVELPEVSTSTGTSIPTSTRTATPTQTATSTATPTKMPTETSTASATPTRATSTPSPTRPSSTPTLTKAPTKPGQVENCETVQNWRLGDQPYGQISLSTVQVHDGAGACQITYDLPGTNDNFVVFLRKPPISLPGQPTGIVAWVYGDGSGNWLNVWMQDAAQEIRQYTFGQVRHHGWQQMVAWFDNQRGWPNTNISGPNNGVLDYPVSLYAFVLDAPDGRASSGVIYLDEIGLTRQPVAASTPTPASITPVISMTPQPSVSVKFWADKTTVTAGECTTLHWIVDGVQAVFLGSTDHGVTGMGEWDVCPGGTTTYDLIVKLSNGEFQTNSVTINVQ